MYYRKILVPMLLEKIPAYSTRSSVRAQATILMCMNCTRIVVGWMAELAGGICGNEEKGLTKASPTHPPSLYLLPAFTLQVLSYLSKPGFDTVALQYL